MDQPALDDLIELLDLERIEVNIFRGQSPDENRQRVFGGQVAGQALVAAGRTVQEAVRPGEPDRHVHSLHAYFLRPGDPTTPIIYEVDRIRDGKSFTTRRVNAIQHGRAIFTLSASFQIDEPGLDHALAMPEAVPDPDGLDDFKTRMAPYAEQMGDWFTRPRPIDLRFVTPPPTGVARDDDVEPGQAVQRVWFRADEWLLYDQVSPSASGARGLAEGKIFTMDGKLAVSVVQEGLVRVINR